MKKFVKGLFITSLALILLTGCQGKETASNDKKTENTSEEITVVLDYLPNTNHTGIYAAIEKGYYKDAGLNVEVIEPGNNDTSISLVAAGKGQIGISYQEDVTYAASSEESVPIKAIATVLEHNTSDFVTLKSSGITSPKDFDGKTYAGWQSPSEEAVLKAVMTSVGADFSKLTMVGDTGGGAADLGKNVDIKWFFEAWDIIKSEMDGYELNKMPLRDLDPRLDYYTPVVIASDAMLKENPDTVKKFLAATKKGYLYAIENPDEAAEILHQYAEDYDLAFLKKSQNYLTTRYADNPEKWGEMKATTWDNYTDFMVENKLIDTHIDADQLFTNEFLPED